MNAAMMTNRLLWKEFRVLRLVWLMCVIGVAALMGLVTVIAESQPYPMDYATGLWGFAIWVPPVYILAALATMFAGEREEGTLVWLSVLAPPPGRLMTTKLLYVVVTGAALQGSLALAALLLSQFDSNYRPADSLENLFVMSFLLVESVVWGWFWSLQTTKPLNAILYGAISLIVMNLGCVVITEEAGYRYSTLWSGPWGNALGFWGWGRLIVYAAVVTISAQICDRWLAGRPWDWGFVVQWWASRSVVTKRTVAVPEAREPWQREWQRLRWLEWQSLRTFAGMIGAASVFAAVTFLFARQPTPAAAFIFCWLTPLVAGLMAWQGEQSRSQFRMLSLRGASSAPMWWNKLALWTLAAAAGAMFVAVTSALCWEVLSWAEGLPRYHSMLIILSATHPPHVAATEALGWMLCYGAMQFALAFTCAHLSKNVVVALGCTMIGTLVLTVWFYVCIGYALPTLIFLAPIPLWLLWMSASYAPAWWIEQTGWRISRRRWRQLGIQASFTLMLPLLAAGYRVWEVPRVDLTFLHQPSGALPSLELSRNVEAWNEIVAAVEALQGQPELIAGEIVRHGEDTPRLDLDPWIEKNHGQLTTLRDQLLAELGMHPAAAIWQRVHSSRFSGWQLPVDALAKIAVEELAAGRAEESARWLRASFRLFGARRAYADLNTSFSLTRSDENWRRFVYEWAQHPAQTEGSLKSGLNAAAEELRFVKCETENLWTQYQAEMAVDYSFWPWEEARHQRRLAVAAMNRATYLLEVNQSLRVPSSSPAGIGATVPKGSVGWSMHKAWSFRAAEEAGQYNPFQRECRIEGLTKDFPILMHQLEGRMRAVVTVMGLVGYRRIYGELPASISRLRHLFFNAANETVLKDVWSGREYGYEPRGVPNNSARVNPQVQLEPFIWSEGPHHIRDRAQLKVQSGATGALSYHYGVECVFPIPAPIVQ
ncbi:MAG: hypothetical protein SFV23_00220 [Planctomycetaceae bacterium]|nr:hypothetical protein [Planctomycetaceae bacterium]